MDISWIADKISKRQVVAVIGMLVVEDPYLRTLICLTAIASFTILAWRKQREKKEELAPEKIE